jgi:hypothetical protein
MGFMQPDLVIDATCRWITGVVIGLNLCPFARRVFDAGGIRFAVTAAQDVETLRRELARELTDLAATPRSVVETTLLIHPQVLGDFLDFNDFLADGDRLLESLDLRGTIQIASFHPAYQFAGTAADAVENFTNRSPYPMLHLIREVSITEVANDPALLDDIPKRNIETLRRLGRAAILERFRG